MTTDAIRRVARAGGMAGERMRKGDNMRSMWMVLIGLGLLTTSVAAADVKIAVVDMSKLVQSHPDTKEADELLEKQAQEFEAEKDELVAKFSTLRADFEAARSEASNKALSEAGRELKRDEAREKLMALEEFQQEIRETTLKRQRQLTDQSDRMRRRIVTKIIEVVDQYAAEKGFTLILDTASRGLSGVESVVYADEKLDVTDAVQERITGVEPSP